MSRDTLNTVGSLNVINNQFVQSDISSTEYFQSLEKWMQNIYFLQNFNVLWYNALVFNHATTVPSNALINTNRVRSVRIQTRRLYHLPPVWKRLAAEFVDFVILFVIKVIATYSLLDFLELAGFDKSEIDSLVARIMKLDYDAAMELTSELVAIEVVHRITVCLYETFWLCSGFGGLMGFGATPGKKCFNLRVVRCENLVEFRPPDSNPNAEATFIVEPGTSLTVGRAFARSVIKNFVLAAFLPLTFTLMYFQNNRTGYDIITQSLVIEDPVSTTTGRR